MLFYMYFFIKRVVWDTQKYIQFCHMLSIWVKVAFKTHSNKIPLMLLLWRQQELGKGFKKRVPEDKLRSLFYMQSLDLTVFYTAFLQFLIIQVQNVNSLDNSSVQKVKKLLTTFLVFSLFLIRGCRRAGEIFYE
jgi:hypothetical protein